MLGFSLVYNNLLTLKVSKVVHDKLIIVFREVDTDTLLTVQYCETIFKTRNKSKMDAKTVKYCLRVYMRAYKTKRL